MTLDDRNGQANDTASAEIAAAPKATFLTVDCPIWAGKYLPARQVFPDLERDALVCFLGGTTEGTSQETDQSRQLSGIAGRLSRVIPLYLAEQIYFRSDARPLTWAPWISSLGEFTFFTAPYPDGYAANYTRSAFPHCKWLVTSHLRCGEMPWTVEVQLIRVSDSVCVEAASVQFDFQDMSQLAPLAAGLPKWLADHGAIAAKEPPGEYVTPSPSDLTDYLVLLDELLRLRYATVEQAPTSEFYRIVVRVAIEICLRMPESTNARLILACLIWRLREIEPLVIAEFSPRVRLLQNDNPLLATPQLFIDTDIQRSLRENPADIQLFERKARDRVASAPATSSVSKDEVRNTSVLICALDRRFWDTLKEDAEIYRRFYPATTAGLFHTKDAFFQALDRRFDVVHLLADVDVNGVIALSDLTISDLIERLATTDVKLFWIASGNGSAGYIKDLDMRGGHLNLIMTLDRRGHIFGVFLDRLLSQMSSGVPMPIAWNNLAPQIAGLAHPDVPAAICAVGRGGVRLRGGFRLL
jgi:hypothetical protein